MILLWRERVHKTMRAVPDVQIVVSIQRESYT